MMALDDLPPRAVHWDVQLRALVEMAAGWPTDEQRARFLERIRLSQGEAAANLLRREIWKYIKEKKTAAPAPQKALFE